MTSGGSGSKIRFVSRRGVLAGAGAALALPRVARAADKLSVKLDFLPWGLHAPMHLANANGWFRDAGLEVEVQDGRGSANTLQLVNAGQFDVGQIQVGLLSQAAASGAKLTAFAGFLRGTDLAVLVPEGSGYKGAADFRGKSLVVFATSPWAPFVDLWLKSGGQSRETVNVMMVDPSALFGTYTAGRADGLMSPIASALPVAQKARPSRAIMASASGIRFPSYGLVTASSLLPQKREALKRLVEVQQRCWAWVRDGHVDEATSAMLKQRADARLDPEIVAGQLRLCIELMDTPNTQGKPIGWQSEADWQAGIQTQLAAGVVKPGLQAGAFFTNELIG
ncbi:MAG TPA: ABC transporter substrate-binding protein [Rhodopila sp.]|nr:ABC transporter substrate-binding protein [Rhodopila sp.]